MTLFTLPKQIKLLTLICFIALPFKSISQQYSVKKLPKWINNIEHVDSNESENGEDFRYLLVDFQDNVSKKTSFSHFTIKMLNTEGIQNMSDVEIDFDPTYQKLQIHYVEIIRNGKTINKLTDSKIQTVQKEKSADRLIYDGSLTTIINLSDVRENDILNYAYSEIGFNPVNKGNYGRRIYQSFTFPVNRAYNRIIANKKLKLNFKYFNNGIKPTISEKSNSSEYVWDIENQDVDIFDNNTPIWYNPHKMVQISTFKNWVDVVDWAVPLFKYNSNNVNTINLNLDKNLTTKERVEEKIRFVQNEIRYLGFENGISAYKPHAPTKVYNQRYGDCKDKSLLLVALLQKEGVEAYPMLVHSTEGKILDDHLPTNYAFDHCVVYLKYDKTDYFIDPTISNQAGSLEHISFPNYHFGLIIKPGNNDLTTIPFKSIPKLTINETITVNSIEGEAKLNIRSNYAGSKADNIRDYFNSNKTEIINKEYLDFYSSLYPKIELQSDVYIYEDFSEESNEIIIEENYLIKDFWLEGEVQGVLHCETYPLVLETLTNYANSATRSMPFYLGEIHEFKQVTVINLPEEWPIEDQIVNINGEGFEYENIVKGFGDRVEITHAYALTENNISSEHIDSFFEKHNEIKRNLSYYLTYNSQYEGFQINWILVFLSLIVAGVGIFLGINVYNSYNPEPLHPNEDLAIGGWLVLPGIGIVITPFFLLYQFFTEDFFNENLWLNLFNSELENKFGLLTIISFELMYNIILLVFTGLLIALFFNRKTSFPKLILVFYIANIAVPIADLLLSNLLLADLITPAETSVAVQEILRSILVAAIWIPYFLISKRVKNTFVYVNHKKETGEWLGINRIS